MTREQAITTYVENLSKGELVELLQHMNAYDGYFEDCVYFDMDDLLRFNAYGNLESADWYDVEAEAEDLKDDIIDHLVNHYSGDTPWTELDYIVDSDDDALFNDDLEEVDEEEDR